MQEDFQSYKIVVIGSSGTGKTNISTRFTRGQFNEVCPPTLGVEFMTKIVEIANGRKVKISLWDTCGQQRYRALSKVYYKGASAAIVVYDITDPNSYIEVESWMKLLNEHINIQQLVLALVGNKLDLERERQVPKQRPQQEFSEAFGIDCWEVSAKTGQNINELFLDIIQKIIDKTNDIKSTMYRGTTQYESERGTMVTGSKVDAFLGPTGIRNGSVIIEVEEDDRSVSENIKVGIESIGVMPNRMTLSVEECKKHKLESEKKKKKCCWG